MSERSIYDKAFGLQQQNESQPHYAVAPVTKYDSVVSDGDITTLNIQISGVLLMLTVIGMACICMYICSNVTAIQQKRRNLWTLMGTYAIFVVIVSMRRFCC